MSSELLEAMKSFDIVIIYALIVSFIAMIIVYAIEDFVKYLWKRHKAKKKERTAEKTVLEETTAADNPE